MMNILLVDDDQLITGPVKAALVASGFVVEVAHDGATGLSLALQRRPDVVVLDVMMPEMDGWQVCRALREKSTVPILMLTALGEEVDRVLGLELGADDYLTKPFSTRELLARIRAMLRRVALEHREPANNRLQAGRLMLDLDTRQATLNGEPLRLRFKEFELLSLLMSRPGEVFSRAVLFDRVWGTDWIGDTRTLDVHVRWLREKIEADPAHPQMIQTVRSVGYRFVEPEVAA